MNLATMPPYSLNIRQSNFLDEFSVLAGYCAFLATLFCEVDNGLFMLRQRLQDE